MVILMEIYSFLLNPFYLVSSQINVCLLWSYFRFKVLNVFNTGAIDLRKKNQFPCFNFIKVSCRVLNSRQADSIWTLKDKKLDLFV